MGCVNSSAGGGAVARANSAGFGAPAGIAASAGGGGRGSGAAASTGRGSAAAASGGARSRGSGVSGGGVRFELEGGPHTATSLKLKRDMFWETRTVGSAETWASLKLAAEALLAGDAALAETVLQTLELRPARGDLSLVYDVRGVAYELPPWLWRAPCNLVSDAEAQRLSHSARRGHTGPVQALAVTLRLSANGGSSSEQDVRLELASDMPAAAVSAALHAHLLSGSADQAADASTPRPNLWRSGGGCPPARQRLVFRGRVLASDVLLQEAGVASGDIIQVFIRPT